MPSVSHTDGARLFDLGRSIKVSSGGIFPHWLRARATLQERRVPFSLSPSQRTLLSSSLGSLEKERPRDARAHCRCRTHACHIVVAVSRTFSGTLLLLATTNFLDYSRASLQRRFVVCFLNSSDNHGANQQHACRQGTEQGQRTATEYQAHHGKTSQGPHKPQPD